jgi:beta-galactosidase
LATRNIALELTATETTLQRTRMNFWRTLTSGLLALALPAGLGFAGGGQDRPVDLAGRWRFALDRADGGQRERWFDRTLPDQLELPGALQAQGYGDRISTNTAWVLSLHDRLWYLRADYQGCLQPGQVKVPFLSQPPRHYLGPAWYQRDIDIPATWQGRRVVLFLERPHWESTVWLDDLPVGSCRSLVAPHIFDLGRLVPGRYRLTIRVDNRMILPYRPDAHSVSDSLGGSWNGIVGRIELRSTSPVWIESARVFPNLEQRAALIKVRVGNRQGREGRGTLSAGKVSVPVAWSTNGGGAELEVPLGASAQLWDEFHPALQRLTLRLEGESADDTRELVFGVRDFRAAGQEFLVNGRKTHLRGTHHGGDFPLTGYPPAEPDYWRKLFRTCRDWGLNHVRFHSFCPPEAAFQAADELGVYLQPECGMWNELSPGTAMEGMLYEETERLLEAYGNHPSLVMLSPSNEPKGRWKEALPRWVEHFRSEDPQRLYTTGTGWSAIDEPGPVAGADYLAIARIGLHRVRGNSAWFGRDYSGSLPGVNVPVVAHELGQWCAYPDYDVIRKFTGYLQAGNYEIFRDSLAAHGLLEKNKDFARASGRFQLACYKEEIEANLRTPGLAGFQLLDLHDYTGQGTALVGVLDPFWESKGYGTPEEFRRFCGPTVPLARLMRRVFTTGDAFVVPVEVAHYGAGPLTNTAAAWSIVDASGAAVAQGVWPARTIPVGRSFTLGEITADLSKLAAPGAYKLVVALTPGNQPATNNGRSGTRPDFAYENDWNFWVYPANANVTEPEDILVSDSWDEAEARLVRGGKVLFVPRAAELDWTSPPLDTVPVFWNRLMNPGWGRMLGLWCDTNHPALAQFPGEAGCDWQWTELLRGTRAVNLDRLPGRLQPIVQAIDDWNRNYKLGLIFECRIGAGRLMVCSVDIRNDLEERPVARQLRRSLLNYMAGPRFQPPAGLSASAIRAQLFNSRIMRRLEARAEADGTNVAALLDGNPNTFWSADGGRRGDPSQHPCTITIRFPRLITIDGFVLMNRQNDRDHLGDIRGYVLQASDDGLTWRDLTRGELASTWSPQTVKFTEPVSAKQLRLVALSGFGPDTSVALAEFAVLAAGSMLPDDGASPVQSERVRSTSADVDEGGSIPASKSKATP